MEKEKAQETWEKYYEQKNNQRIEQANKLWQLIEESGASNETTYAMDFSHFCTNKDGIEKLAEQLSENYEIKTFKDEGSDYWFANGTTRPYGNELTKQQHLEWVQFMFDVAKSYGCVFSTWQLEAPALQKTFKSEDIDSAS